MAANISFVPSRKGPNGLSVTSDEKQRYDRMFMALLPPGHQLVGGDKMKEVFLKSGLPPKVLGVIWLASADIVILIAITLIQFTTIPSN